LLNASSNEEDGMNPWKVSAQFAAFIWYTNRETERKATAAEAAQFARDNWIAFLPYAHEGYGRLLIKISRSRGKKGARQCARASANPSKITRSNSAVA
jgi:hypothetical protein